MTQDPHRTSWDSPEGEQPVEPSAGPSQPRVSDQPSTHGQETGGWAQPTQPQPQQPTQQPPVPPAPGYGPPPQAPGYGPPPQAPGYGYGPPPQAPGYGPPPQAPGYGYGPPPQAPGYGYGYAGVPAPAAPRAQVPGTAIVLLVVSGVLTLLLSWSLVGLVYLAPTVLGVVAVVRGGGDPAGARKLARTGWMVFGAVTVLLGVLLVIGTVLLFSLDGGSGGTSGGVSV